MGIGDQLIATGLAKGAAARGKRIAFGPGGRGARTAWDKWSPEIFRGNPNIAAPGTEGEPDVEWIDFRKGHRLYNSIGPGSKWRWHDFHPVPGEVFFSRKELAWAAGVGSGFVLIEPNVEFWKKWASNKTWPGRRYDKVAAELTRQGHEVVQFMHANTRHVVQTARLISAPSFRHALAALRKATLYIGSEGGMHHGAAAVGVPGVVLFGGFIDPKATGYDMHMNLTGGATACGSMQPCLHCRAAMRAIGSGEVLAAARSFLVKETMVA